MGDASDRATAAAQTASDVTVRPGADFARFVAWVVGMAAAAVALGWLPTRGLAGEEGVRAMLVAVFVTAAGSLIGALPIYFAVASGTAKPQVVLISMLVRLGAVVVLAASLAIGLGLAYAPFLGWLALSYLLLLVVDTRYATGVLGKL